MERKREWEFLDLGDSGRLTTDGDSSFTGTELAEEVARRGGPTDLKLLTFSYGRCGSHAIVIEWRVAQLCDCTICERRRHELRQECDAGPRRRGAHAVG